MITFKALQKIGQAPRRLQASAIAVLAAVVVLGASASPALAETHPFLEPLGGSVSPDTFTNPNGIAVEESTGDVYVADLGSSTVPQSVSKFDSSGALIESWGTKGRLTGTPSGPFSFPEVPGTPAEIAVDNSSSPSDPNAGDLYVMDAGHEVVDRFSASGTYLGHISGPVTGFAVAANGEVLIENNAEEHGFAAGPTGDVYELREHTGDGKNPPCGGCVEKYGGGLDGELRHPLPYREASYEADLGQVDKGPGDVAVAVDPVSGHVYVDDQSSVAEWDTGAMDGVLYPPGSFKEVLPLATLVSSFTALGLSGVSGQGGIAVNGTNGNIYVSNSADGEVYVFASTAPGVAAGAATNVSQTGATLQGSVDPRGVPVSSCEFEYEKVHHTDHEGLTEPVFVFTHSVPCAQGEAQIGSGTSSVGVSADVGGLEPGVLYDFRLNAGNAGGTSPSEGRFVTGSSFGIKEFGISFLNQDGTQNTQAGSHPYEMVTSFALNTTAERELGGWDSRYRLGPAGNVRDVIVDTPPGLIGDPNATESKCTFRELQHGGCPPGSQVGELQSESTVPYGDRLVGLYNMVPPHGVAAQLGTFIVVPDAFINVGLKTGGQYPLQAESLSIPAIEPITGVTVTLFGEAGQAAVIRAEKAVREGKEGAAVALEEAIRKRKPFLTLPTGCTGPLRSSISADSYQEPGHYVGMSYITHDANGNPLPLSGCSLLTFPPAITVEPDVTDASSSSGLKVGVHVPQTAALNPEGLAESSLRDTTVALPAGVAINPAGADGLEACSEGLAGFEIGHGVNGSGFENSTRNSNRV